MGGKNRSVDDNGVFSFDMFRKYFDTVTKYRNVSKRFRVGCGDVKIDFCRFHKKGIEVNPW